MTGLRLWWEAVHTYVVGGALYYRNRMSRRWRQKR